MMGHYHNFPPDARPASLAERARIACADLGSVDSRLSWHQLLGVARAHPEWSATAIDELRQEAEALSSPLHCDWRLNTAITDACQAYVDCPCDDCLDELDALLNKPERSEDEHAWDLADMRAAGFRSYAERTAYAMVQR